MKPFNIFKRKKKDKAIAEKVFKTNNPNYSNIRNSADRQYYDNGAGTSIVEDVIEAAILNDIFSSSSSDSDSNSDSDSSFSGFDGGSGGGGGADGDW